MAPETHGADERTRATDFEALLTAAVDAIVLIDAAGRILAFNAAAERMFECAAGDVLGEPVTGLMPEPYRSEHDGYMARYLAHGEPRIIGKGREVEAVTRSGRVFPVWLAVGEAEGERGRQFVGILRDLSAEKAAENERRALEARLAHVGRFSLMGEMAAGIAHEINQPLGAISTYAQALRGMVERDALDTVTLRKAVEAIADQAERASRVIGNLHGFIRQHDIETEACDLNAVIEGALPLVRTDTAAAGIRLRVELAAEPLGVDANAVQLQQVLLNLTRNAVDAMTGKARGGEDIVIRTRRESARSVALEVADRGPGVSSGLADGIFHPFVTTKRDGLGVGLAISRTIVRAHGGTLAYTDNPGGGALFRASLPVKGEVTEGE